MLSVACKKGFKVWHMRIAERPPARFLVLDDRRNNLVGLESKAIRTLRIPSRSRKFKPYFEQYLSAHSYHHVGVENFQRTWMSEVEREALREMEWEEEHRRIMEEADQDLEENERIKEMLGHG